MAQRPVHRPRSRPGRHAVSSCFPSPVDRSAGGLSFPRRCWRRRPRQGFSDRQADRARSGTRSARAFRVRPRRTDRQGGCRASSRRRRCSSGAGACRADGPHSRRPHSRSLPEARDRQGPGQDRQLTKLQRPVARRMAESKATAPALLPAGRVRPDRRRRGPQHLKANRQGGRDRPHLQRHGDQGLSLTLRGEPQAESRLDQQAHQADWRFNVGFAVAAQDGLFVATVFEDADHKGLTVCNEAPPLTARVREESITPPRKNCSIAHVHSSSNLGMYEFSNFSHIIDAPQPASLTISSSSRTSRSARPARASPRPA